MIGMTLHRFLGAQNTFLDNVWVIHCIQRLHEYHKWSEMLKYALRAVACLSTPFWPLWCYYYLYFTYHSHFKQREKLHTLFPRPCKTLYCFDLTQTVLPCVLRPHPSYIDLDTPHSCILLTILCFSSHFIGFTLISLVLLLPTLDCVYEPTHSFTYPYLISIELDITTITTDNIIHCPGADLPGLHTFRSFKFPVI